MTIRKPIKPISHYESIVREKIDSYGEQTYVGAFTNIYDLERRMEEYITQDVIGFASWHSCMNSEIPDISVTSLNLYKENGYIFTFSYLHHESAKEEILPFIKEFCEKHKLIRYDKYL